MLPFLEQSGRSGHGDVRESSQAVFCQEFTHVNATLDT